jgi:putative FmdB family regulatory protein
MSTTPGEDLGVPPEFLELQRNTYASIAMPLHEFVCHDCGCEQEILIRGSESPVCEHCGSGSLEMQLSLPIAHGPSSETPPRPAGSGPCGAHCGCHPH